MKNRHGQSIICPSFHETTTNFEHTCSNCLLKAVELRLWGWFYKILILAFMQKFTKIRDSWLIFMLKPHVTLFFKNLCPKRPFWRMVLYILTKKNQILAKFWQFWRQKWAKIEIFHENSIITKNENFAKITSVYP